MSAVEQEISTFYDRQLLFWNPRQKFQVLFPDGVGRQGAVRLVYATPRVVRHFHLQSPPEALIAAIFAASTAKNILVGPGGSEVVRIAAAVATCTAIFVGVAASITTAVVVVVGASAAFRADIAHAAVVVRIVATSATVHAGVVAAVGVAIDGTVDVSVAITHGGGK